MRGTTCTDCDRAAPRVCARCLRLSHEAALLEDQIRGHPVASAYVLGRDLDWLAELDRQRGVPWLENLVARMGQLAALAELAEIGRCTLHRAERHRANDVLAAHQALERLIPDFNRLVAAGKSFKEIRVELGKLERDRLRREGKEIPSAWKRTTVPSISKERLARLQVLAASEAEYRRKFK